MEKYISASERKPTAVAESNRLTADNEEASNAWIAAESLHQLCGQPNNWTISYAERLMAPLLCEGMSLPDIIHIVDDVYQAMLESEEYHGERKRYPLKWILKALPDSISNVLAGKRRKPMRAQPARKEKDVDKQRRATTANAENNMGITDDVMKHSNDPIAEKLRQREALLNEGKGETQ
jgi:hypothetical protein